MNLKGNVEVIIMGDCNIDYNDIRNKNRKMLKELEAETGLKQVIHETTGYGVKNSILDIILRNSNYVMEAGVLDVSLADHEMIYMIRKKTPEKNPALRVTGRSYVNYCKERFQEDLVNCDWSQYNVLEGPNELWKVMKEYIVKSIDKQCPLKTLSVRDNKEPWLTTELIELLHDKDYFRKRAKKSGRVEDWEDARLMRDTVNTTLRQAKQEYVKDSLKRHEKDAQKFWKTVSKILPNNKNNKRRINVKDPTTGEFTTVEKVSTIFNQYFANIGETLAASFPSPPDPIIPQCEGSLNTIQISEIEVRKLCEQIEIFKSSAIKDLSSKILKDAFTVTSDKLTFLFNCSVSTGLYPDDWKVALVRHLGRVL